MAMLGYRQLGESAVTTEELNVFLDEFTMRGTRLLEGLDRPNSSQVREKPPEASSKHLFQRH
jgi:hypothetical protein